MDNSDYSEIAARLRGLADDLAKLRVPGYLESVAPLPTVMEWYLTPREVLTLRGHVVGHPSVSDGPFESSQLFFASQEFGLARTLSRWYRLGTPLTVASRRH